VLDRRVQAREFGLDVVELLQGLAAAGAEAFIEVGHPVVHGGGSWLAGSAVERLFAGGSPAAASPSRQAAGRGSSMSLRAGCLCSASQTPAAGIRLLTHNAHEWTERYPAVVAAMNHLPVKSCLIDGEGRNDDRPVG